MSSDPPRTPAPLSTVDAYEGGRRASRIDHSGSAPSIPFGTCMSEPWWILLPFLTPLAVIVAALALQHLERKVVAPSRDAPVNSDVTADGPTPVVLNGR
jgi:hypothetical protein